MNSCGYQQKALMGCVGVGEIRRGDVSDGLVCPKPRLNGFFNEPFRPSRFLQINNQQTEDCDLKAGTELLDIILAKEKYDMETPNFDMASSPPFFSGSPPSRTSNPLIQDSKFRNNNFVPILTIPERGAAAASAAPSPPSVSARKSGGGCTPVKFGIKPAAVRIEGFNCRSSISAVAYNSIEPLPDRSQWNLPGYIQNETVHPPKFKRLPGRPRKKFREKSYSEIYGNKNKNSCSTCGGKGHNRRSCRNAPRVS